MSSESNGEKQNVTISLSRQLLKKARILAARRETSLTFTGNERNIPQSTGVV